jgi:hypothetical protein
MEDVIYQTCLIANKNAELRGLEADRKLDISLAAVNAAFQDSKYPQPNVPIIKKNNETPRRIILTKDKSN